MNTKGQCLHPKKVILRDLGVKLKKQGLIPIKNKSINSFKV